MAVLLDGRPDHECLILVWRRDFVSSPKSLVSSQFPIKCIPGIKRPERDIFHTSSAINDVKSVGSYISIYLYVFVAWRLTEHRDDWRSLMEVLNARQEAKAENKPQCVGVKSLELNILFGKKHKQTLCHCFSVLPSVFALGSCLCCCMFYFYISNP